MGFISAYRNGNILNVSWTNLLGYQLFVIGPLGRKVLVRPRIAKANNQFSINISRLKHTYNLLNGTYRMIASSPGKPLVQSASFTVEDLPVSLTTSLSSDNVLTVTIQNTEAIPVYPDPKYLILFIFNTTTQQYAALAFGFDSNILPAKTNCTLSQQPDVYGNPLLNGNYVARIFYNTDEVASYESTNSVYYNVTGEWPLTTVLQAGNTASTDIDMDGNDLLNVRTIYATDIDTNMFLSNNEFTVEDINADTIYTSGMWLLPAGTITSTISESLAKPREGVYTGCLLCDGSLFNKDEYPELAAIFTNGALPDLNGYFLRGAGTSDYSTVNTLLNTFNTHTTEAHNHTLNDPKHEHRTTEGLSDNTGPYLGGAGSGTHTYSGGQGDGFLGTDGGGKGILFTSSLNVNIAVAAAHVGNTETAPSNYSVYWVVSTGKRVPQN